VNPDLGLGLVSSGPRLGVATQGIVNITCFESLECCKLCVIVEDPRSFGLDAIFKIFTMASVYGIIPIVGLQEPMAINHNQKIPSDHP